MSLQLQPQCQEEVVNFSRNEFISCVPVELPDIWVRASGLERCLRAANGKEAE